jgi:hypothetical protein
VTLMWTRVEVEMLTEVGDAESKCMEVSCRTHLLASGSSIDFWKELADPIDNR